MGNDPLIVMYRLMSTARQLSDLLIYVNKELELNDLIVLDEMNREFEKQIELIESSARETSERLHQMILAKGLEPRHLAERRIKSNRRVA